MRGGHLLARLSLYLLILLAGVGTAGATPISRQQFDDLVAQARATMLSDPRLAADQAYAAQQLADRQTVSDERSLMHATSIWLQGEAWMRLNQTERAKALIDSTLQITDRIAPRSKLQADALLSSGWINTVQARVADALDDYQRAHAIFQQLGDGRSQSKALQAIGSLYSEANDHANALRYFEQALAIYRSDPTLALTLYNSRGIALKDLGRYHAAEAQFREALALTERIGSPLLRVLVLGNIAEARLLDRDVPGAERAIAEGLTIARGGEGGEYRKLLVALGAQAAFQRHDLSRARALISERFRDEDMSRTTLMDRPAHRTAYTIYRATGEHDLALQHLVALKRLDDEATALARSKNAALMAARFDFANQELKIANLQRDEARRNVAYEQARTRTQRNVFLGAAGAAAILVGMLAVGLVTIRRSRNEVRDANADLAVTNAALGKALAAKTEFLATTSHEIRTPLNGILGMTQVMLADRAIGGATRDRLSVVHSAGVTMRALVDDILDVAKMEAGNLTIEHAPFDLKAMLAESTRLWEDQAQAKGLAFARDLDACPGMIVADAARLRQIVFNLMSNALKFTASGSVTLTAGTVAEDRLRITIADTGVGIAADARETIFESFRQADTSTTRRFGGTGLGLAICRNLARAMGGDVQVASRDGEGSCFTVDLPLVHAAAAAEPVAARVDDDALLIVDRNPITRNMLKTLMAPHAPTIVLASTRDEAVARLGEGGVARLLVDGALAVAAQAAIGEDAWLARAAGQGVAVVVLWPAGTDADHVDRSHGGLVNVIKPVTGASLVATLYPPCAPALVSQAA
ncbi:tetratricopeptide repeat protein [Sphingomonas sp. A2-49]|uniref:ATP-binding protein n=1 Tax=Sphingomonas sp. A2-49 TaxID=1391375 RepID=UPI0021D01F1B|nr:ATP-binding protein [Sphingomonas sp. A2-49]MCU6453527.1 tetratricopeptide repeat protein [Sphingomonas sp. A2-49]